VTVRAGDRLVCTALGATGEHNQAAEVQVPVMPDVPGPDDADDWVGRMRLPNQARSGWTEIADMRRFELPNGHFGMWGRMKAHAQSRASVAFLADFVPVSVSRAARVDGAGFSLDNSVRYGYFVDTEWVLLDFDPWFAAGNYLHGAVRLFAQDGTLLGVASQTAAGFIRPLS
jgi:acyl-CoA thioesterase